MSATAIRQVESPSRSVIEAVADREGVDPVDLTVPLYDAVDPEALDTIIQDDLRDTDSSLRIEFRYHGYAITVSADGSVQVSDAV